jgi:quercetin dioxygenase-like cupin family protein
VLRIRPGDTVWCPPGEEHWHGADPEHFMTHLAIWDGLAQGQDGPETAWGPHVTDEEYGHIPG